MADAKTVLILGITGGYGQAMARELRRRGYRLKALVRDRTRGQEAVRNIDAVTLLVGDVLDRNALNAAAQGVDFIVHGVNAPYHKWDPFVAQSCQLIADVAAQNGATVVFPGNVYNYEPGRQITEQTVMSPPTEKGRIRVQAEAILTDATTRGARLITLRGGDFFGLGHASSWASLFLGRAATGGRLVYPAPLDTPHQWAFLPDFARAHADLMARAGTLAPAATFHFEGHVLTGHDWLLAARQALGDSKRKRFGMPWWALRVLSWVSPMLREVLAMRYLWSEEVTLSGQRLRETLGHVAHTPVVDALAADLEALALASSGTPRLTLGSGRKEGVRSPEETHAYQESPQRVG